MSLLDRVRCFFDDIRRIRVAIEHIRDKYAPPAPRDPRYTPRTFQSDK